MAPLSKDKEDKYNKFWLYISFIVIALLLGYVLMLAYTSDEVVNSDVDSNENGSEVEIPASDTDIY